MSSPAAEPRRLFGPVVVLGIIGTGLAAFAGGRPWASADGPGTTLVDSSGGHEPLAAALGLAGLACWGVLLVTRGWLRRGIAVLSVLVAVGLVGTSVVGRASTLRSARTATVNLGSLPTGSHTTAWWYVALVAAVLALLAALLSVRYVPAWPEMGSRYDAPTAAPQQPDPSQMEGIDLWRAIDRGHDPTDPDV